MPFLKCFRPLLSPWTAILFLLIFADPSSAQTFNASYKSDQKTLAAGQSLFQQKCAACHSFKQQGIGPNLAGLTSLVSSQWLTGFISNSQEMVKNGDKRAVEVFKKFKVPMPSFADIDANEMTALLSYLHTQKKSAADKSLVDKTAVGLGPVLENPVPLKIAKAGLTLKLEQVLTAPATAAQVPVARINQMTVLKDSTERVFLEDLRGQLYQMMGDSLRVVFDISKLEPAFIHSPGHATGFGSFAFHPAFLQNGLFYTTHTEKPGSVKADFVYEDSIKVFLQWIITEWKIDNPGAAVFTGTPREVLRINMPSQVHGMQQIAFNPLAAKDSADFGLLYIGIGDGGTAEAGFSQVCSTNKRPWSSVLRIDPLGNNSKNGRYGIPVINPFAADKDPATMGEIFVRGFRNPNRFCWAPDGRMLIADIGLNNIEELNIAKPGADYGWPAREGSFVLNYKGRMNKVYRLPPGRDKYLPPVVQYDHDEGNAISAGFVYDGPIEILKGKYIFGDIVGGRVFYVETKDLVQGKRAVIKEFALSFDGKPSTFNLITDNAKADLRFGIGENNNWYLYTKTDGRVWILKDVIQ